MSAGGPLQSLGQWLWPAFELPKPGGPHRIGTTWIVVKDARRQERFSHTPGAMRELPVKLWYPVSDDATGTTGLYAAPESVTALFPVVLNQRLRRVKTHTVVDAPMPGQRAPVLVFSHGYGGYAEQNTVQMEELASRGYVVASVAHPGEAAWAPYPDGRGVAYAKQLTEAAKARRRERHEGVLALRRRHKRMLAALDTPDPSERLARYREFLQLRDEPLFSESVKEWALDTKVVVDHLETLDAGQLASPFQGRLDLKRLGVFGMSYGGATAVEFGRTDPRCMAAANIDGLPFGGLLDGSISVPLLVLAAGDEGHAGWVPGLDRCSGPTLLVKVPETTHMGLTDLPLQMPPWLRWTGMGGRMPAARRGNIMNDLLVAFFDQHLLGRGPAAFSSLPRRFPELSWTARHQEVPA
jgi:predicted dienelactone hydrolase